MSADHYAVLGLTPEANAAEVRKAFRTLSRRHHPDLGGDAEAYRAVTVAYTVLSDPKRRSAYDAGRDGATDPAPASGAPTRPTPHGTTAATAPSAASASRARVRTPVRLVGSAPGTDPGPLVRGEIPKRGFLDRGRPGRRSVVESLTAATARDVPALKAVLGPRLPTTGAHDAALVAGRRVVLVDVVLSKDVPHGWDGTNLRADGKRLNVPSLARATAELERSVGGIRAQGIVVVAAAPNEMHRPVVQSYASTSSALPPMNPAQARREIAGFLASGPDADAVDLPVLAALSGLG